MFLLECGSIFCRSLTCALSDYVRHVSLLTILYRMVDVFVTVVYVCWAGPICMLGWSHLYVGLCLLFGMWYFGDLTKLCVYGLWFNHFQVLLVPKGMARFDCTTSSYDSAPMINITLL